MHVLCQLYLNKTRRKNKDYGNNNNVWFIFLILHDFIFRTILCFIKKKNKTKQKKLTLLLIFLKAC